jgi:ABC-type polysaccharide/polyol phosphate export permease
MDVRSITSAPSGECFPPAPRPRATSRWAAVVRRDREELWRFWPVIQNMAVQELRVRYQRSWLGFFWTLLNPILMMTILTLVFSRLFPTRHYAVYLFAGMVPWGFLSANLGECAVCIINNEGLIKRIYIPKLVFPLAKTLVNLLTFLLSLVALFVLLKPLGSQFSLSLMCLPVVTLLFAAFTLGLSLIVATANTFFRDCGHLVAVVLQAWYFATPIMYPVDQFAKEMQWRFYLNPAFPFIRMFQLVIRDGEWPDLSLFVLSAGVAAVSLGIGYAAFKSQEDKLVFRL